jgi:hypothetical protein
LLVEIESRDDIDDLEHPAVGTGLEVLLLAPELALREVLNTDLRGPRSLERPGRGIDFSRRGLELSDGARRCMGCVPGREAGERRARERLVRAAGVSILRERAGIWDRVTRAGAGEGAHRAAWDEVYRAPVRRGRELLRVADDTVIAAGAVGLTVPAASTLTSLVRNAGAATPRSGRASLPRTPARRPRHNALPVHRHPWSPSARDQVDPLRPVDRTPLRRGNYRFTVRVTDSTHSHMTSARRFVLRVGPR